MAGGLVRLAMDKRKVSEEEKKESVERGTLYTSGLIAGEGLMGVVLAVLAVLNKAEAIDVSKAFSIGQIGSLVVFALLIVSLVMVCLKKKDKKEQA